MSSTQENPKGDQVLVDSVRNALRDDTPDGEIVPPDSVVGEDDNTPDAEPDTTTAKKRLPKLMRKRKSVKKKEHNEDLKGSVHGSTPFVRFLLAAIITLVSCALLALFWVLNDTVEHVPYGVQNTTNVFTWFMTAMFIPNALLFFSVACFSFWILPQSSVKYSLWLVKESFSALFVTFLAVETIIILLLGLSFYTNPVSFFIVNSATGLSPVQGNMWAASLTSTVFVAWFAYRVSWVSYRQIGAQTMQQRYEEDLRQLEVKNSGRVWDRFVSLRLRRIIGVDGRKPRMFTLSMLMGIPFMIMFYALYMTFEIEFMIPLAIWYAPAMSVLFLASVAKYRDGRYASKHAPYLNPVRDWNTVDEYDPSSRGVRKFAQ